MNKGTMTLVIKSLMGKGGVKNCVTSFMDDPKVKDEKHSIIFLLFFFQLVTSEVFPRKKLSDGRPVKKPGTFSAILLKKKYKMFDAVILKPKS